MMKRTLTLAAMAALSLAAPNPASALTTVEISDIDFYSDSSFTQVVGHAQSVCTRNFQGAILVWGYSTQYRIETGQRPCGPGYYDDQ